MSKEPQSWMLKIFIEKYQEWWFVSKISKQGKVEIGNKFEMGKAYKAKLLIEKQIEHMKEKGWGAQYEIVSVQEEEKRIRQEILDKDDNEFTKRLKEKRAQEKMEELNSLLRN